MTIDVQTQNLVYAGFAFGVGYGAAFWLINAIVGMITRAVRPAPSVRTRGLMD